MNTTTDEIIPDVWAVYKRIGKNSEFLMKIFLTEEEAVQYNKRSSGIGSITQLDMYDNFHSKDFQGWIWCLHENLPYDRHSGYYGAYFNKENALKDLEFDGLVPAGNNKNMYLPRADSEYDFDFEYISIEKYFVSRSPFVKCANKK